MPSYAEQILADGAFAHLRLNESSGTTADNAEGTAAYDGTYVNSPTLQQTGAIHADSDKAVDFDRASSQYIDWGALGSLGSNAGSGITFECWLKSSHRDGDVQYLLDAIGTDLEVRVSVSHLDVTDDDLISVAFQYDGVGRAGTANLGSGLLDGAKHHIVAVLSPTANVQIYVDGASQTVSHNNNGTVSEFENFTSVNIARKSTGGLTYFDGLLDEVAIYNSLLDADTIALHYALGDHVVGEVDDSLPLLANSASATYAPTAVLTETLPPLSDAIVSNLVPQATTTETLPLLSDAISAGFVPTASIAETLPTLTDTIAANLVPQAAIAETLPLPIDAIAATQTFSAAIGETLPLLTDAIAATETFSASVSETLPALSDSVSASLKLPASIAETLPALADAVDASYLERSTPLVGYGLDFPFAITEALLRNDPFAWSMTGQMAWPVIGGAFNELPALSDSINANLVISSSIAETLPALNDSIETDSNVSVYRVYRESVPGGEATLVQTITHDAADLTGATITYDLTGLPANHTAWYYVKAVSSCGVEDIEAIRRVRIATDADGNLILPEPDPPFALSIDQAAGGAVSIRWEYLKRLRKVAAASFNVYRAVNGAIDFDTVYASKSAGSRSASLGTHNTGDVVEAAVRAVSADDVEEDNLMIVSITVDTTAPSAADELTLEVIA